MHEMQAEIAELSETVDAHPPAASYPSTGGRGALGKAEPDPGRV